MTLPASGQISMSQVSTELGRASNYASSLGETAVRNLAGVPSGAIAFSNLHGKSAETPGFGGTLTCSGYLNYEYRSAVVTIYRDGRIWTGASSSDYDGWETDAFNNNLQGYWFQPVNPGTPVTNYTGYYVKCVTQSGNALATNNTWQQVQASYEGPSFSRSFSPWGTHSGTYILYLATAASDSNIIATSPSFSITVL